MKSTEELCLMALMIVTEFKGKLNCASKNDMKNLTIFHHSTKSQNWNFDDIPFSKVEYM